MIAQEDMQMNLEFDFDKRHINNIPEFIIEFLFYADYKDIKSFLEFIPNIRKYSSDNKLNFLANLLEPIQKCAEYDIQELPITLPDGINLESMPYDYPLFTVFQKAFNSCRPLHLHIIALCECFFSYVTVSKEEKSLLQKFVDIFTKFYKTDNQKIHAITDSDKQKIFRMLINCYKNYGFYYYFNGNYLAKISIKEYKQNNQIKYNFDEVIYEIYDDNKSTHLINHEKGIDYSLKKILLRYDNKLDLLTDEKSFRKGIEKCFDHVSFETLKNLHNKIVDAIKNTPKNFCKLCNPNYNNPDSYKLCPACDEFLKKINEISENINQDESNEYLYEMKNRISRYSIFNEFLKKKSGEFYPVKKRKKMFIKLINELKNAVKTEKCHPNNAEKAIKSDYNKLEELILQAENLLKYAFQE